MVVNLITAKSKKISLYQDFKKDLELSPISSDITLNKDDEAVKESIRNLILTDRGERLMQPNLGGNIRAMLFENLTPATVRLMEEQVRSTVELYEPRAELIDVTVSANLDSNQVAITIEFYVTNDEQPVSLSVFLERTR
jgi:phage baseplate assembly protein W